MSNSPSDNRGGRRPAPSASLSLGQVGRDEEPLLLPIPPGSSIEEIVRLVREAATPRIELLVPDGTAALQSIANNQTLRAAAQAAGSRVTIFTADEKTTHAARFAKLDVVSVGGTVAAPRPGETPRPRTGQHPAVRPQSTPPAAPAARPSGDAPRGARPAGAAPADDDFLTRLETFEQGRPPAAEQRRPPADDQPPRMRRSDQGALIFDVPGDIGVPRPANNDDEWANFERGRALPPDALDMPPPAPDDRGPAGLEPQRRAPRPSLLGALFGFLPSRRRAAGPPAQDAAYAAADDDQGLRMARPERSPEEAAARRRQSRNLLLWPLVALALLIGVVAIVATRQGGLPASLSALTGRAPTLTFAPPVNTAAAQTFTGQRIPLVADPVTDPRSINVQGLVLTAPVTVTLQGTASQTAPAPIGRAQGTIVIRNRSSQAIPLAAGTVVRGGGQEFRLVSDVTIPARTDTNVGSTFGVAEAQLEAVLPGAQSNIPAGSIAEIPGYSGNLVIEQSAPFAGGTDQEVPIVSPDDVSALLPQALTQLYAQGVNAIMNQVQQRPGFVLIDSAGTPEITPTQELLRQVSPEDLSVFPAIGDVIDPSLEGRFTLQMSRQFEALASPADQPIEQQLQRAVTILLSQQGQQVTPAQVTITGWRRGDQGLIVDATVTPTTGYLPVPPEVQEQIQTAIRGRSRAEAEQYLAEQQAAGVIGAYALPPEMTTVPENVEVRFAAPEPQPSAP